MNDIDSGKKFYGRGDILNLLRKRVIDLKAGCRQNVAILGSPFVGKSALLKNFVGNIEEDDVIPIYVDLENKDFTYFLNKFIGSLLYNYSQNRGFSLCDDVHELLEASKTHLPQTIQVIKKVQKDFLNEKIPGAFLGLLTLPEIFANETGKCCVLILDEFQNLEEFGIPDVFQTLGKKIMTQKRCFYIVTSSYKESAQKILSEKLALLFGHFERVILDCFDVSTSCDFIKDRLEKIKIGAELSHFLADFTGGHPLYLDMICKELINLSAVHKQQEVYVPLLSEAIEHAIFDRWGVISRHFELVMNDLSNAKGNREIPMILIALANLQYKVEDILQAGALTRSKVIPKLNYLIEKEIVAKNGHLHYIKDKLFKYWIKYVYQRRLKYVELSRDKRRFQFRDEFSACVEQFNAAARQDFSSRIMDLFACFDNEAVDLNGRKYKLPVFQNIAPSKLKDESGEWLDIFKASTEDAVWFVVSKTGKVGEGDVNTLLREAKSYDPRPQRCLIVSLMDLDENARLKALQERCWIWNEKELNTLLTLFEKPYIAR